MFRQSTSDANINDLKRIEFITSTIIYTAENYFFGPYGHNIRKCHLVANL